MHEFTIKNTDSFKLICKISDCATPAGLKHMEFVQEHLDSSGNTVQTSTYEFFLDGEEIKGLANYLSQA
jgi:hypothetical protein